MTDVAPTPTPGPPAGPVEGHTEQGHDDHGHVTSTGISNEKLAMWVFLGSECLLFGGLISTFILYRGNIIGDTELSDVFEIPFTSVSSFVLLMSSLTMVLAVTAIKRGDHRSMRTWLAVTALMGTVFISGQFYEFYEFAQVEGFGFTHSPAWSSFYALTGFHGVHVTVGIVMLISTLVLSLRGRIPTERAEAVEIVGLYWHFVDIVWILLFTIVYLIR
ncbi:cytochrome o ubiquinol oxidase subunit III [soil metagenome]